MRLGRYSQPGQIYLLTTACYQRQPLLANADAAKCVLDAAQWLDAQGRIELFGVVIMPDHVHLVCGMKQSLLDRILHSFKGYTAHRVNHVLGRSGSVWQAGYHDHALRDDESVFSAVMYCLGNPIRAGMVADFRLYPHWWCRWKV